MFRRFKHWLAEHGIWWHSQNLNEDDVTGRAWKSKFWHGRAWLHVPHLLSKEKRAAGRSMSLGVEWAWRKRINSLGVSLTVESERLVACLDLGLLALYPSLEGLFYSRNWRSSCVMWNDEYLRFELWRDDDGWAKGWKGLYWSIAPRDVLFGRKKYHSETLCVERAWVPMPEGSYPATVTLTYDTWKRPRSPFTDSLRRARVKPDKPIPIPGKGENSWDCADDAIFEGTYRAATVEQAVAEMVESVLTTRRKHGWDGRGVQVAATITGLQAFAEM